MRSNSSRATLQQSQQTASYYGDIAALLARKKYRKVPDGETIEKLLSESNLSGNVLIWYTQAKYHEDFDSTLESKLVDARADNPA